MDYTSLAASEAAGRDPKSSVNNKWRGYMPNAPQPAQQAAPQQQKAPDMSAYSQLASDFRPPQGARSNNLSGQVPSNQMWAQAYNQASNQYGGNTQAQSWTMPGSYASQSYNPSTGQYSQPTGGQSWDGNMAYNAIDSRPGPIQATATGVSGRQMPWQDTLSQRDAFVGNLSQRLNQYNGGQLTGAPTFNASQLVSQADGQLANGTWQNPFASQDVQGAVAAASPYASGSWQNPFGNSPQANVAPPSLSQPTYAPQAGDFESPAPAPQPPSSFEQFLAQRGLMNEYRTWATGAEQQGQEDIQEPPQRLRSGVTGGPARVRPVVSRGPGRARPIQPPAQGTRYDPQADPQELGEDSGEKAPVRLRSGVSGGPGRVKPVTSRGTSRRQTR
jgi:hypothetical protein